MARKKRIWYPGATYHVMNRGNRKEPIFKDNGDYLFFLKQLQDVKKVYPFKIHSICLMTNHFHIELETEDVELGKIMRKLLTTYVAFFNSKHSLSGHLFGGRYTACLIKNNSYFLEVSRYIHLNPVKANIVKSPLDYKYSSYPLFVSNEEEISHNSINGYLKNLVDTSRILNSFEDDPKQYKMFVEDKLPHFEHELLIMREMKENEQWLPVE